MKKRILLISIFIIAFMLCIQNIVFAAKDFSASKAEDDLSDKEAWIAWIDSDSREILKQKKDLHTGRAAETNKFKIGGSGKIVKNQALEFHIYFEAYGMDEDKAEKWTKLNYVEKKNEKGEFKKVSNDKYQYIQKGKEGESAWWFTNEAIDARYVFTFFSAGEYKCHMHIGDGEEGERIYYIIQVTVDKNEEEKYAEEIETAYQGNVPSTSDGAKEIIKFVVSDVKHNSGTKINTVIELDKLKAWKVVIEEFNDKNSPAMAYKEEALKYLEATISEKEGTITAEEAEKIREKVVKSMETILYIATSTVDPGQDRTANTFYDVLGNVEDYIPGVDLSNDDEAEEMLSVVLSIITNIGMVLSVLIPAILGVKYMLGSTEEKAQYKESLLPYVIGSILLFGICSVVKILQEVGIFINS